MVKEICGTYKITYQPKGQDQPIEIDFTPPFRRISMMDGLKEYAGIEITTPLDSEGTHKLNIENILFNSKLINMLP
jgi:lysyl-tRNA synthetase class 2